MVHMENQIEIRNLNVSFDGKKVLKDINLAIPKRQITVIIGPSGCGKTTLMKSLNRLLEVEGEAEVSGKVLVDGTDIYAPDTDVVAVRKKMGLLSQKPYPLPMSIYDNVAYGPKIHGEKDRKKLDAIVEHYLKVVGLWDEVKDRLKQPATSLSVGQQQRLCLARGLSVQPEIILCDEPTSALDPVSAERIEQKLVELKKDYTIVVVTHFLRQAKRIADNAVFIYDGRMIESGPAKKMFTRPRQKKTAEYMKGKFN